MISCTGLMVLARAASNNFRRHARQTLKCNQGREIFADSTDKTIFSRNYSGHTACPVSMRFVQFQRNNEPRIRLGVVSADGGTLAEFSDDCGELSTMINLIKSNLSLDQIREKTKNRSAECISSNIKLLSPITDPEKIICVGLNYRGHCLEQNKQPPEEPMFFSKFASTIVGPTDCVILHPITTKLDWEVELAVVIGKEAKNIRQEDAMEYVFGYTVAQDISARDWQKSRNGGQFLIGKSMDTFCPLGPALVHKSLVPDPYALDIKCSVNGVEKQCGKTGELIFKIDDLIARLTQSITLRPGDVILTGTPGGVGFARKPPEYLKHGDVIESEISCIGKLINTIVPPN